jgi:hypothetical protein
MMMTSALSQQRLNAEKIFYRLSLSLSGASSTSPPMLNGRGDSKYSFKTVFIFMY